MDRGADHIRQRWYVCVGLVETIHNSLFYILYGRQSLSVNGVLNGSFVPLADRPQSTTLHVRVAPLLGLVHESNRIVLGKRGCSIFVI